MLHLWLLLMKIIPIKASFSASLGQRACCIRSDNHLGYLPGGYQCTLTRPGSSKIAWWSSWEQEDPGQQRDHQSSNLVFPTLSVSPGSSWGSGNHLKALTSFYTVMGSPPSFQRDSEELAFISNVTDKN
ncbi:hypothetical protein GYMLUDRAFT_887765 [Collybiopsis luxurians FD-317 M1]|uniref:Uncharacterized protein n=1 Tax=Collybiopsis luxurians FD-317 M1 TaxID=944289 RepID=A0A0D0BYV0_9AGAR|nr:hypothetical protein GYMLUDRAFT_887765 [Collybiopsis luxurians FD-317 M1]